ncbi:MAG: hypothetical protein U0745_07805 [Polyangia bacterium]|jgi:hypothetical protein
MLNWLGVAVACALVLMLLMVLARRSRKEDLAATDAADDPDAAERAVAQHPAAASQTEATAAADGEDAEDEASDEASTGEDEEASASEDAGQKKRSFLHSRHWAILAGEPEPHRFLLSAFEKLLQPGSGSRATGEGRLWHLVDNSGRLQLSALVRKGDVLEVLAIYPYAETANSWPLQLDRIDESPDGLQARLCGQAGGAHFAVFDTLYFKNHEHYLVGETYELQVSAIAYQLEFDEPAEASGGQSGFGALPVLTADRDAAEDEVVFHSTVEDVFECEFWGIELQVYLLTLLHTQDGPLRVELYTHPSLTERRFAVGDRVRGVAWLFGLWPDPRATALAEALKAARLPN